MRGRTIVRTGGSLVVRAGAPDANRQDGREPNRQGGCAGGESSGRAGSVCWRTQGGQKAPRMSKMQPEGGQKASKSVPKPQKNESVFPNHFRMPPGNLFSLHFGVHFGFFWEPKSFMFHVFLLPSFLNAFLDASGWILGVILVVIGRSFLVFFPTL